MPYASGVSACAGALHGQACNVTCDDSGTFTSIAICTNGSWNVHDACKESRGSAHGPEESSLSVAFICAGSIAFVLTLLLCFCCARRIYWRSKPKDNGVAFIPAIDDFVSYQVRRPLDKLPTLLVTPDSEKSPREGESAKTNASPLAKTHVVWDLDIEAIQQRLESRSTGASCSNDAIDLELGMSGHTPGDSAHASSDANSEERVAEIFPAYADGQSVEYFSHTHQQWMVGVVHVQSQGDGVHGTGATCIFNVRIHHRAQLRPDVALDSLRPSFKPGDLVEVYTRRYGGSCIPAVIAREQPTASTLVGYHVELEHEGMLKNIPAYRLRRRFPAGSRVEVYRGIAQGWCAARVHGSAISADGCGAQEVHVCRDAIVAEAPDRVSSMATMGTAGSLPVVSERVDSRATRTSQFTGERVDSRATPTLLPPDIDEATGMGVVSDLRRQSEVISLPDRVAPWTNVPLDIGSGEPEWTPSYLLRTRAFLKC